MRPSIISSLVLLAAFAGCSDDDDNGTTSGSTEHRIAVAYCSYLDHCYPYDTGENVVIAMIRGASDTQCADFLQKLLFNGRFDAAVAAGTMTVDKSKLDACLSALGSQCVDNVQSLCMNTFEGQVALGATCTSSDDCAGDAYCEYGTCGGKCTARHAPGAACDFDDDECSQATGSHGCGLDSEKCLPKSNATATAAEGAACGSVDTGEAIVLTSCAAGFGCESSKCQKIGAVGATCENDHSPCALGSVCMESNDEADTGTCTALPLVSQAGADCNEDFEGGNPVICNWALGLGCRGGKCVAGGDGSVGAACFHEQDLPAKCDAGNYCGDDDKCAAQKDTGGTCQEGNECKSDFCNNGKCEAQTCP